MYRKCNGFLEVLLVHPGGPFWAKKDTGSWTIPKGEFADNEEPLEAAKREFEEETGFKPEGEFHPLKMIKQAGRKIVLGWFFEGNCDASAVKSNTFSLEWPPRSGKYQDFPEVDRAGWFTIDRAREKILSGQLGFIEELVSMVGE